MMTARMSKEAKKCVTATLITGMVLSSGATLAHADNTNLTTNPTAIHTNVSGDNGFNGMKFRDVGYMSMVGEVGQKGNGGFISSGKGDAGGKSYGLSQFTSTKAGGESANYFVSWLKKNHPQMGKNFDGAGKAGTASFDSAWKKTYRENPVAFEEAQSEYTFKTYVNPAIKSVKEKLGVDFGRSRALLEMIYSTSVQFGETGTVQVFSKAGITPNMDDKEIVEKCTDEKKRSVGVYKFTGCSKNIQKGVYNRFTREGEELKDIIDGYVYLEGEGSNISQQTLDEMLNEKVNESMSLDDVLNKEMNSSLENSLDNALNNKIENNSVEKVEGSLEDTLNSKQENVEGSLEDTLNSKQENVDETVKDKTEFDQILDSYENNKEEITESTENNKEDNTVNSGESLDDILNNVEQNEDVVEDNSDNKIEPTPTDKEDVKTEDANSDEKVDDNVENAIDEKIEDKQETSLEDALNKVEEDKNADSENTNSTQENTSVDDSENTEDNNTNDVEKENVDDAKEDSKSDEKEETSNDEESQSNIELEKSNEEVNEDSAKVRLEKEMETNVFARLFETTKLIMESNRA